MERQEQEICPAERRLTRATAAAVSAGELRRLRRRAQRLSGRRPADVPGVARTAHSVSGQGGEASPA